MTTGPVLGDAGVSASSPASPARQHSVNSQPPSPLDSIKPKACSRSMSASFPSCTAVPVAYRGLAFVSTFIVWPCSFWRRGPRPWGEGGRGPGGHGACIEQARGHLAAADRRDTCRNRQGRHQARTRLVRMTMATPINVISSHRVPREAFRSSMCCPRRVVAAEVALACPRRLPGPRSDSLSGSSLAGPGILRSMTDAPPLALLTGEAAPAAA